jgi:two-component system, OmpR family, sensor histidine kinase MprB
VSLKRRIALAAALAVAAVAVAVAVISYTTTRSHLLGEVQTELQGRAQAFLGQHNDGGPVGGGGGGLRGGPGGQGSGFQIPGAKTPGGATGLFQVVEPDGTIALPPSGVALPVTNRVLSIARSGSGSTFYDARVGSNHIHYEIYAVWDAPDQHVVQVALPLTDNDAVLHSLLLPYGLLIGGGVLLAALLGLAISRSALAPIERFVSKTEHVARDLDRPARLEETDAIELRRLAASFNHTLDALERSIEAQRHLVADASHELRTPIAALRSNIQIFLDADRLPPREREDLQQSILAELDELTQIVADVVELARGSAPSTRVESVELDTIVRDAVERARRRAPGVQFRLDLEPTVIEGVAERIARAVANVIDNARKWSPADGAVDVRLHGGTLEVRDHGPGFADKDLPHVFDRFYRAENARRLPGSGLGLAIVKQAAEAHGGHAEAANAPDGGAIVRVSFGRPLELPAIPEPAVGAPQPS